ncbi:hypothetical protein [Chitinophaga sp. Cy-1792]|uniref:hypothetical protein n=1 Tax=Chitinophaga sp. Cy-1792 TaxID=2608339 RepID=UPI00141F3D11|nr:hypothetical protein [Chitinophaga sp. Cy-1792]NIG55880.1 hypothetical protein [Chitinophaga sp. Cy-1792]
MKWLLFLCSIYIVMLSAVPCSGDDDCCQAYSTGIADHQQPARNDNHHKPELPCSPFFSCNTCHGGIVPEITIAEPSAIPLAGYIYNDYTFPLLPEFAAAVWQPPQLS